MPTSVIGKCAAPESSESAAGRSANPAVTERGRSMTSVQAEVPLQSSPQPANDDRCAGVAVSVSVRTVSVRGYEPAQEAPLHSMPPPESCSSANTPAAETTTAAARCSACCGENETATVQLSRPRSDRPAHWSAMVKSPESPATTVLSEPVPSPLFWRVKVIAVPFAPRTTAPKSCEVSVKAMVSGPLPGLPGPLSGLPALLPAQ